MSNNRKPNRQQISYFESGNSNNHNHNHQNHLQHNENNNNMQQLQQTFPEPVQRRTKRERNQLRIKLMIQLGNVGRTLVIYN